MVLGRVGEATKAAQHLLESIGFEYLQEVDPFDGGPHYGCSTQDILPIKSAQKYRISESKDATFSSQGLMARATGDFRATLVAYDVRGNEIIIPEKHRKALQVQNDDEVIMAPFDYDRRKEQT